MNNIPLKLFLSAEQECSYLDNRISASVFADPDGKMDTSIYSILINQGFRRSANIVYRPHCPSCNDCKATRVPVKYFSLSRSQKRTFKRNQDLKVNETQVTFNEEHFELYKKYVHARHETGEMNHDDPQRYLDFFDSHWCSTAFYEFRLKGKLLAVAVTDLLTTGLSAVYTFFDPDYDNRSLGNYAILWQIKHALRKNKSFLYLGYWIKACQKMEYKIKYRPIEIWQEDAWVQIYDEHVIQKSRVKR